MTFKFNNADIKEIVKISAEAKAFRIPYEGEKTQTDPTLWIVADAGVYLCPSLPGLKYPLEKKHIAYADGCGPNTRRRLGDGVYDFPLTAQLTMDILSGGDLEVTISNIDETITCKSSLP